MPLIVLVHILRVLKNLSNNNNNNNNIATGFGRLVTAPYLDPVSCRCRSSTVHTVVTFAVFLTTFLCACEEMMSRIFYHRRPQHRDLRLKY